MLVAVLGLVALLIATAAACRRPSVVSAVALVAACLVWLVVNSPLEGPVLWTVSQSHGLTLGDLLVPLSCLAAGSSWLRRRGRRVRIPTRR